MKTDTVEFVRSAAGAGDLPDAGLPEFSMVGRSNVGKSSLINGLVGRSVARTSATPGKTRLINLYRVVTALTGPFYLVDLPGYGYARKEARAEFDRLAAMYFASANTTSESPGVRLSEGRRAPDRRTSGPSDIVTRRPPPVGVLLALDARHPGLENDLATLQWLRAHGFQSIGFEQATPAHAAPLLIIVTKIDKLSATERRRALDRFEQSCGAPVLAVSAATGEGLKDLWKQMTSWVAAQAPRRKSPSHP